MQHTCILYHPSKHKLTRLIKSNSWTKTRTFYGCIVNTIYAGMMLWKRFSFYWPLVKFRFGRPCFPKNGAFLLLGLTRPLGKQSSCWWFKTPWQMRLQNFDTHLCYGDGLTRKTVEYLHGVQYNSDFGVGRVKHYVSEFFYKTFFHVHANRELTCASSFVFVVQFMKYFQKHPK